MSNTPQSNNENTDRVRTMFTIKTRLVAIGAAVALGAGLLAFAAPADAGANVGTATVAEADKVQKETFKQSCLTPKEVAKIVHGNGDLSEEDSGWECDTWIDEQAERAQDRALEREQQWLESYGEEEAV